MKTFSLSTIIFLLLSLCISGCNRHDSPNIRKADFMGHMSYQVETIGVRPAGSEQEKACADYIYDQFFSYGYSADGYSLTRSPFTVGEPHNLTSENIMAVKKSKNSKGILAVVAHYDTMPSTPGARDNAGGIAALLELSRLLKDIDSPYEIRFIALGAEEIGYWGSLRYVEVLSPQEKDSHLAVYNMDITIATLESDSVMTLNTLGGRKNGTYLEGNIFEPASNLVSTSISDAYRKLGYPEEKLIAPVHYGESDQVSFHNAGIDSANVCWRLLESDRVTLPREYHLPEDDLAQLDYETLVTTISCIATAIMDMK